MVRYTATQTHTGLESHTESEADRGLESHTESEAHTKTYTQGLGLIQSHLL